MATGRVDIVAAGDGVLTWTSIDDGIPTRIHAEGGTRSDLRLVVLRLAFLFVMRQRRAERRACEATPEVYNRSFRMSRWKLPKSSEQ